MSKYKITNPIEENKINDENLFPEPTRCLIIGNSGSGKTTVLYNIISKYWIPYKNLYIFTTTIEQPIYQKLEKMFEDVRFAKNEIGAYFFKDCDDLISLNECKANSLVVFDDCIKEKQSTIQDYFLRSRPKNISCIYLCQCYTLLDIQTIRINSNFLIIFKQPEKYIKNMWEDFIKFMTYNEFLSFCLKAWEKPFGFVSIDLNKDKIYNKFE